MLGIAPIVACVPALDLARARRFYEEKLGLVPKEEYNGGAGLVYECGQASTFFMYQSAGAGTSQANQAFWTVDDLDAEMAALRAKGVRFEDYDLPGLKTINGVKTGGGSRTAWFKDSEGNTLALSQRGGRQRQRQRQRQRWRQSPPGPSTSKPTSKSTSTSTSTSTVRSSLTWTLT